MVMAIFVLVMLTGMAIALLFLSQNEVRMSTASLHAKQAFYTAEAGVEAGRMTLFETNGGDSFTDDLQAAAGPNGTIDFDPASLQPIFDAEGRITGFTDYGDDVPLTTTTALGEGLYMAFLTNDPDEPSPGMLNTTDSNDRVMVTGVGTGPEGSLEVAQAIVELELLFPALPPATVTMLGPTPFFEGGNSMAKDYSGDDCNGSGVAGLWVPVLGVDNAAAVSECTTSGSGSGASGPGGGGSGSGGGGGPGMESGGIADRSSILCGMYKEATYHTDTLIGHATTADVTDSSVIGGAGPIHPDYLDCSFVHDLVEAVRLSADVICSPGHASACSMPPAAPDRVVFVDGDFFLDANDDGQGLLMVTGQLDIHGDCQWVGTLWALGEGVFIRNGSGNEDITGSIFVANIAGPDGLYGNADDCTGGVNGFGEIYFNAKGGGSGDTVYCSNVILDSMPAAPYPVVEFLQR
jgi:hypothetical protein